MKRRTVVLLSLIFGIAIVITVYIVSSLFPFQGYPLAIAGIVLLVLLSIGYMSSRRTRKYKG